MKNTLLLLSILAFASCKQSTEKKITDLELENHRNNLENLVELRTEEVNSQNLELERMNKLFVGRELRMRELKNIIKELNKKNEL